LDSYAPSQTLEVICEVGGEGGSVKFYKVENNGKERFFFLTDKSALSEFACDKILGVDYLDEYDVFEEAMAGFMEKYQFLNCILWPWISDIQRCLKRLI
jgi:hypothetical protein